MRFADFALCAIDELVNQAAKARFMFGGQGRVPLVVREPIGMWRSSAAQHSQSLEAWYAHIPGLVVVAPVDARGQPRACCKAAIRCDDPVVYMEHKDLWASTGEVDRTAPPVPLGKARMLAQRPRPHDRLVVRRAAARVATAAETLVKQRRIDVEMIDLRTISGPGTAPWCSTSCARTGRLLVVHEAVADRRLRRGDRGDRRGGIVRPAQGAGAAARRAAHPGPLLAAARRNL